MLFYFSEMMQDVRRLGLSEDEIMIVGSSAITACGGRKNNDIEFCVCRHAWKKVPLCVRFRLLFLDHTDLSEHVDLFRNRYLNLGIQDYDLFTHNVFRYYEGIKIVSPEIEYAYKEKLLRPKDTVDLKDIESDLALKNKFDFRALEYIKLFRLSFWNSIYVKLRVIFWKGFEKIHRLPKLFRGGGNSSI